MPVGAGAAATPPRGSPVLSSSEVAEALATHNLTARDLFPSVCAGGVIDEKAVYKILPILRSLCTARDLVNVVLFPAALEGDAAGAGAPALAAGVVLEEAAAVAVTGARGLSQLVRSPGSFVDAADAAVAPAYPFPVSVPAAAASPSTAAPLAVPVVGDEDDFDDSVLLAALSAFEQGGGGAPRAAPLAGAKRHAENVTAAPPPDAFKALRHDGTVPVEAGLGGGGLAAWARGDVAGARLQQGGALPAPPQAQLQRSASGTAKLQFEV